MAGPLLRCRTPSVSILESHGIAGERVGVLYRVATIPIRHSNRGNTSVLGIQAAVHNIQKQTAEQKPHAIDTLYDDRLYTAKLQEFEI
jgi:hypothetical protein